MEFESKLEELAYPIIKQVSDINGYIFNYQESVEDEDEEEFRYHDWVYEKYSNLINNGLVYLVDEMHEEAHGSPCDDSSEDGSCSWGRFIGGNTYEIYRIDFTISKNNRLIGIELDGKKYHNSEKDIKRDYYLKEKYGYYDILRYPAYLILKNILGFKFTLENDLEKLFKGA